MNKKKSIYRCKQIGFNKVSPLIKNQKKKNKIENKKKKMRSKTKKSFNNNTRRSKRNNPLNLMKKITTEDSSLYHNKDEGNLTVNIASNAKTEDDENENQTMDGGNIENDPIDKVDVFHEEDLAAEELNVEELESNDVDSYVDSYDDDKCIIEKVQIFGTDGKKIIPILTDSKGRLIISDSIIVPPVSYKEVVIKNLTTTNHYKYSRSFDISRNIKTSFIIINHSSVHSATIQLQDSPDDSIFQIDLPEMIVAPNSFIILTPTRFIRYQRIAYRSTNLHHPATIDIYYQAQGNRSDT